MDEKIRKLVEGAEGRAAGATGDVWDIDEHGVVVSVEKERNYPVALDRFKNKNFIAHARQDVPALCTAIREMNAAREQERAFWQEYVAADKALTDATAREYHKAWERYEKAATALRAIGVEPNP